MTDTFVYVSCRYSFYISILRLDYATGVLTETGRTPVGGEVMPLAISPDRRYLYASLRDSTFSIGSFRIDPASGALTELGRFPVGESITHVQTDRTCRFLFAASYYAGTLRVHPIGSRGLAQRETVTVEHHLPKAHCMMPDPSNRFVLAPVLQSDMVAIRRFDAATGMHTHHNPPSAHAKTGHGPRHTKFHPNSRYVYVLNELGATLDAYAFDIEHGTLGHIQHESLLPPGFSGVPSAAEIDITPDGRLLYASERASSTLCAFAIDRETGRLTKIGHYETGTKPRAFAIDPRGKFLLSGGQLANCVVVHAIDPLLGGLTEIGRTEVGTGQCWVEAVDLP